MNLAIFAALLLLTSSLFAQTIVIPEKGVAAFGGFTSTTGEIIENPVNVAIQRNAKGLHIEMTALRNRQTAIVKTGKSNDDTGIFDGEVMEFIFSPEPESGSYYHIGVNPAGYIYTANGSDTSWNPESLQCKVSIGKNNSSWTTQLEIPFAAFGQKAPAPGTVWRGNFAVTYKEGQSIPVSWSGANNYHKISQMGTLFFGEQENVTSAVLTSLTASDHGIECQFVTTPDVPESGISISVDGLPCRPERTSENQLHRYTLIYKFPKAYIPPKELHRFELTIQSGGKTLLKKSAIVVPPLNELLELDKFYYSYADKEIRCKVNAGTTQYPAGTVLSIFADGKDLITKIPIQDNADITIPLDPKKMQAGRYVAELSWAGTRTSRLFFLYDKLPENDHIASSDKLKVNGCFFELGGKATFLIGGSGTEKTFLHRAEALNMQAAGNYGLQKNAVILGPIPGARITYKPAVGYLYKDFEIRAKEVDRVMKNPNCNLRRIAYEAQLKVYHQQKNGSLREQDPVEFYKEYYRFLKNKYPWMIFSIHIDAPERIDEFGPCADVFETSFRSSSFAKYMIPDLERDMKLVKKAAGNRPVIFWLGVTLPDVKCRTAEELRAAHYLAVIYDIAGTMLHLGHGILPQERSRVWSLISGICAEIQLFQPQFCRGIPLPNFIKEQNCSNIALAARRCGNEILLIAVNTSGAENHLSIKTEAGNIDEILTPYEGKVYRMKSK